VAHAVAVRDLKEAVLRDYRADAQRLEQDVEAWVARARATGRRRVHEYKRTTDAAMPPTMPAGSAGFSMIRIA